MAGTFYKEDGEPIPSIQFSNSQPLGFTEITDPDELSILYFKQNKKLKEDGLSYVATFKVENFGIKKRDDFLTDSNVDYLYTKLSQLLIRLEDGNWKSALYYLNNHLNTITQADINNGYTQQIHDKLINDLTTYISNV